MHTAWLANQEMIYCSGTRVPIQHLLHNGNQARIQRVLAIWIPTLCPLRSNFNVLIDAFC